MSTVKEVHRHLFERYVKMIGDAGMLHVDDSELSLYHAAWLSSVALENMETYPIDKLARWLGFVQAIMCFHTLTSVGAEREYSRPLFREAYRIQGIGIPQTVERV